jgi:hypothetical protein
MKLYISSLFMFISLWNAGKHKNNNFLNLPQSWFCARQLMAWALCGYAMNLHITFFCMRHAQIRCPKSPCSWPMDIIISKNYFYALCLSNTKFIAYRLIFWYTHYKNLILVIVGYIIYDNMYAVCINYHVARPDPVLCNLWHGPYAMNLHITVIV